LTHSVDLLVIITVCKFQFKTDCVDAFETPTHGPQWIASNAKTKIVCIVNVCNSHHSRHGTKDMAAL